MLSRPSRFFLLLVPAFALGIGIATAHAQVTIIGSLGNFDVHNESGSDCNEFDIELEGPHPEDVYHTYRNPNYGSPTITALPGNVGIRVVYSHPHHATPRHAIEHFGVSIASGHPVTAQRFQWVPGTVNVPNPPPPPPPPPPMALPRIVSEVVVTPTGPIIRETAENLDPWGRIMWILRSQTRADGREVALEELMVDDPLIEGATPVDLEPEKLEVGSPVVIEEDVPDPGDIDSTVIIYEVYENRRVLIGGQWEDAPGPHYGTVMMASISQGQLCQFTPDIVMQPDDVEAPLDGAALFVVVANEPPQGGEAFYQWRHEGVDMPGEDNAILEIDPVTEADAGMYTCVIRNGCGSVTSHAAQLTVRLPPTFQWQPVSVTTCAGATAAFMATMSGTTPITYEWMQNNAPLDPMPPRFSVVTSPDGRVSTLMIADVTLADEADYTVRVTNVAGTDVSETAELVVQAEYIPGDVNRDEHVNAQDVSPFVDALLGPAPIGLSFCAADMNHSGAVDGDDVALFVEALIAP